MRVPLGPEFHDECERFAFRFCCEDCAYFLRDERCAHDWPNAEHRRAAYAAEVARREIVFCKEFELR